MSWSWYIVKEFLARRESFCGLTRLSLMTRLIERLAVVAALTTAGCAPAVAPVDAPEVADPRDRLRRDLAESRRAVEASLRHHRTTEALDRRLLLAVATRLLEVASEDEVRAWTLADLLTRAEAELDRRRGGATMPEEERWGPITGTDAPPDMPARAIDDLDGLKKKDELGAVGGGDREEDGPVDEGEASTVARRWTMKPAPMGAMVQAPERRLPVAVREMLLAQGERLRGCAAELHDEVRFEVRAHLYQRRLRGVVVDARPLQPATVTDCMADVFARLELPEHDAPTQSVLFPFLVRP